MAVQIPFRRYVSFEYGKVQQVTPLIRRVIANNPGPFTYLGTGTYIIGHGNVAVIDPGPLNDEHVQTLIDVLQGETVTHILVTHTHNDHSPACKPLKEVTGAKTYAYGPHGAGKLESGIQVEEGGDMDFKPDVEVRHGDILEGDGWSVECVYTPGHTSNHMCFQLREEKALFTGDHIMGWSTSIISPPDGDMKQYMDSLELLLQRDDRIYWPTHGSAIDNPKAFVHSFIAHREERVQQILEQLNRGPQIIKDMVPHMYTNINEKMYPAAARSVLAAMIYMVETGRIRCEGKPSMDSRYALND